MGPLVQNRCGQKYPKSRVDLWSRFVIDSSTPSRIDLNIFDQDKLGKDKSLGDAALSVSDLIDKAKDSDAAGEVLVATDFIPSDETDPNRRIFRHGKGKQNVYDPNRKGSLSPVNKGRSTNIYGDSGDIPEGNVHVNLIKAHNLMKSDIMGKSMLSYPVEMINLK